MAKAKKFKIDPGEFLNTAEELHALVIGWGETVAPWFPAHRARTRRRNKELSQEPHYYQLGRALGVLTWVGIAAAIKAIVMWG